MAPVEKGLAFVVRSLLIGGGATVGGSAHEPPLESLKANREILKKLRSRRGETHFPHGQSLSCRASPPVLRGLDE